MVWTAKLAVGMAVILWAPCLLKKGSFYIIGKLTSGLLCFQLYIVLFFFKVVSINRTKEEIAEYGLGFMVHDKQIRPLCGQVNSKEEQLFGYEVTVYRK